GSDSQETCPDPNHLNQSSREDLDDVGTRLQPRCAEVPRTDRALGHVRPACASPAARRNTALLREVRSSAGAADRRLPAGDAMRPIAPTDVRWVRALGSGTLVAVSAGWPATFTCIVPCAALGVAAAMTLSGRQALVCTTAVWLANQAAGFGLMSYPWTLNTIGWGAAIGVAAVAGTLAGPGVVPPLSCLRARRPTGVALLLALAVLP